MLRIIKIGCKIVKIKLSIGSLKINQFLVDKSEIKKSIC